jgi:hypothetical protein
MPVQFDNSPQGVLILQSSPTTIPTITVSNAPVQNTHFIGINSSGELGSYAPTGAVSGLTTGVDSAVPNNTINVGYFFANGATNASIQFEGRGSGGLIGDIPDGAVSGGVARGLNTVDLQLERGSAGQVALARYSTLLAGRNNTVNAVSSTILGGSGNTISPGTSATGTYNLIIGGIAHNINQITNNGATGTGFSAILGSNTCLASGDNSIIFSSYNATDRGRPHGNWVMSAGNAGQGTAGRSQVVYKMLTAVTTDATPTIMQRGGQIYIPINSAVAVDAIVVASVGGGGDTAMWTIQGLVVKGATDATVALQGTMPTTLVGRNTGASSWNIAAAANTTGVGTLNFTVTGQASNTIRWSVWVKLIESTT